LLTGRQQEIWDFLVDYVNRHGYPPTVREICEKVGLASPSTVHAHLANLERAGYLRRDPTKPRALELIGHRRADPAEFRPTERELHTLPLVGQVAAGGPLLAEENVEDYIGVPEPLSKGGEEFLLRVKGESMINAGILDGDLVVVRRQETASDGEIVVALLEDEATVKRLRKRAGRVWLQPENPAYAPIVADEVRLLGRVVGVMRTL
jgi:repressor LexA